MKLDKINIRLIELLQADARSSYANLGLALNRAESTVRERVASLEEHGIIRGYRADVDFKKIGFGIRAFIEAECDLTAIPTVAEKLKTLPNVVSASMMTGGKPVQIEVVAEDLAALERILENQIAGIGLKSMAVRIVLQSLVQPRARNPAAETTHDDAHRERSSFAFDADPAMISASAP